MHTIIPFFPFLPTYIINFSMCTYVCVFVRKYRTYPKNLPKMNIDIQNGHTSNGKCEFNNHEIKNMTQHKDFCFWENKKKEGNTEGKI